MSTMVQPSFAFVERLVELADWRMPVVGELALGVGVMHEQAQKRGLPPRPQSQHRLIAVGIAEGEDRSPADETVDADRLDLAVVEAESTSASLMRTACRRASRISS